MSNILEDIKRIMNTIDVLCPVTIIFINPFDLIKIDMNKFEDNIWFISEPSIEHGKSYILTDKELSLQIYEVFKNKQDRVCKGTKGV